jgi:MFS family permease
VLLGPRSAYAALLGLAALDAAGYSIIAPVVPAIADETGAGPTVVGALVTMFAVGQLAGYPLAGRGVQRRHASLVLAAALACMVVGDLGFVLGDGLAVYFPARLLQGVGAGGLWIGITFAVLERFPGEEYRRLTGILAAYSVGSILGPSMGAIGGISGPFLLHLGLVLAGAAAVAGLGAPRTPARFGSDRSALRAPGFWLASAGIGLVAVGLGSLEGPLPLHFASELSQAAIAALYVAGAVVAGAAATLAGRAAPRPALVVGSLAVVGGVALAGAVASVPLWVVAVALTGLGVGAGEAGALGILLETIGPERIVTAMVVWSQLSAVGYLAAPVAAGGVAETLGFGAVGLVPLAAAALVAVAFVATGRSPSHPS